MCALYSKVKGVNVTKEIKRYKILFVILDKDVDKFEMCCDI